MSLSVIPEERKAQVSAINYGLATAPDIQDDLKAKFDHGENIFFYLDLIENRINNSLEDIAEDLDLEERYNLINEQPRKSVGSAFRGYNGKDFPDHKFGGLFSKVTNDIIEGIRYKKNGLETADMINPETGVRYLVEAARKGGRKIADMINPETGVRYVVEGARKGGRISGRGFWQTHPELLEDIVKFREESFNHSSKHNPNSPNWNYTTSKMNEKHNKNWSTKQVSRAYESNK